MDYHSTRGKQNVDFFDAVLQGLAEDGGLYVPFNFPDQSQLIDKAFNDYQDFATALLKPFINNSLITPFISDIIKQAFNFPLPLKTLSQDLHVLELFHGPTLSFKDFGARFFAQTISRQPSKLTILVATSGDTGSAVASSFYGIKNVNVFILFPKNKITPRQRGQICCFDKNIQAIEVDGTFDDCQALVKGAFADLFINKKLSLSTANSINIARLLPQMTYYADTAIEYFKKHHEKLNFIIPAGNLGNAVACVYAKQMKLPIGKITLTTNENKTISEYLETGNYLERDSIATLANAMDVGAPSNFERLHYLFKTYEGFKQNLEATLVTDKEITQTIIDCHKKYNYIICPHTATAFHIADKQKAKHQCIVSTAHPAKFEEIIEPILNLSLPIPGQLSTLLSRKQSFRAIKPNLDALKEIIVS